MPIPEHRLSGLFFPTFEENSRACSYVGTEALGVVVVVVVVVVVAAVVVVVVEGG